MHARSSVVLNAPAKINWSLYVINKRDDGYHNILSLMHCVSLYDTLSFEYSDRIEIAANIDIPMEQNLVFKAARLLQQHAETKKGARITLLKEIPSGAGLGGGSSDAAYTLEGLNMFWGLGLSREELKGIAEKIGSDVSFFFANIAGSPISIVEGRGEILTPLNINIPYALLLVKPSVSVSTAWAYKRIGARLNIQESSSELTKIGNNINNIQLIFEALKGRDFSALKTTIHNDFEEAVIKSHPVIGNLKNKLISAGAVSALMSGSGSTVFGVFEDRDKAVAASRQFSSFWNRVVETLITVNR
ncbi:MAG: 4-(cytidine 5'-diphospho)-2-C-methyl-D-erythritol kinase [Thermodesulfovibrionales bacterium]|nr:4-(cytidine 5'-diphospho)-2-C-methyl-D-erythritol kinase [Thermodesulfovibrionales bacterium]